VSTIATTATHTYSPDSRQMPWNVMGGDLTISHASVTDALRATGMDYQVEVRDLFSAKRGETPTAKHTDFLQAPSLRTVVRPMPNGTEKVLAAVGTRFTPIHNADAFSVADVLVDQYGAQIIGAADFRSGGASLLVVDLQRPITLFLRNGEQDVTDLDLIMKNAHDGSAALTFALTGMRLACTNAVQAAIAGAARSWKISHTPNAADRVNLARQSILKAMTYGDAFQAQAQALVDTDMTNREFDAIVARLWNVAEGKDETKAGKRALEVRDQVNAIYAESPTLEGARGTLWGGYNAITEWFDHYRDVRGGDVARAEGALEGPYVRAKSKVWDTFSAALV